MFYPFFSSNKLYSSFCSQFQGHFPLLPSQHELDQGPLPKAPMPLYLSFIAFTLTYDHLLVTLCVSYLSLPPFLQIWSSWWEVYAYFAHCCYTITLHSRLAHSRNLINIHGRKEWRRKEASNGRKKIEIGERREQRGSCKAVMGGRQCVIHRITTESGYVVAFLKKILIFFPLWQECPDLVPLLSHLLI